MPMDEDEILHFEAVVLDDEATSWTAAKVDDVVAALGKAGLVPGGAADPIGWASAAGDEQPIAFSGAAGDYELLLEASGGWWWDTPYATLMQGRHTNRPAAVEELIAAVRVMVGAAPPYYGCTWFSNQGPPLWMRTTDPFQVQDGAAIQFFSRRYLATHRRGEPYSDPPCIFEFLAGGQFLVAGPEAFGEAVLVGVEGITEYIQQQART